MKCVSDLGSSAIARLKAGVAISTYWNFYVLNSVLFSTFQTKYDLSFGDFALFFEKSQLILKVLSLLFQFGSISLM